MADSFILGALFGGALSAVCFFLGAWVMTRVSRLPGLTGVIPRVDPSANALPWAVKDEASEHRIEQEQFAEQSVHGIGR